MHFGPQPVLTTTLTGRLFAIGVAFSIFQDVPISIWALANNLPTQPQKYVGFPAITSFYWIKAIKYLFFSASVFTSIRGGLALFRANRQAIVFAALILLGVVPCIIIGSNELPWQYFVAGSKAWLPWFALMVGLILTKYDIDILKKILDYGIVVNLIVAVTQQAHGAIACPISSLGCISLLDGYRSTGTFSEPNTMALMVIARLILAFDSRISIPQIALWSALLALSMSRASIVLFSFLLVLKFFDGKINASKFSIPLAIGLVLLAATRGMDGLGERVEIFSGYLHSNLWLWGNGFGAGTLSMEAVGHLNMEGHLTQYPTDSMFASLMSQGGVWLLLFYCAAIVYLFFSLGGYKSKAAVTSLFILGAVTIIVEVWPINIMLLALLGRALRGDSFAKLEGCVPKERNCHPLKPTVL